MERKHHIVEDNQTYCAHSNISNDMHIPVEPAPNSSCPSESNCEQTVVREVLVHSLPNNIHLYRQDVVRHIEHKGSLGVVMEVAGDSDSEGSITDESDIYETADENNVRDGEDLGNANRNGEMYDGDEDDTLPDGQVRIVWTDGSESTENINEVTVVDRGFLHGDIVASASDPTGQLGLVVDVSISVDLQSSDGEILQNISTKDLKRIREFTVGDYVVLGPWLGRVDEVLDNVTVLFDDGSVCKVIKADPLRLKAVSRPVIEDANSPYYPSQRVRAVSSSVFKSSRWLSGLWKANRLEGTVVKVQTASVIVYWMTSAYLGVGTTSEDVPSEEQNPKDLTLLSCFSYANWQLGDWCLLQTPAADKNWKSLNVQDTMEGYEATCQRECSADDSLDCDSIPKTRGNEHDLAIPNILNGSQPSETENSVLALDTNNTEDAHAVNKDSKDHQVTEQIMDGYAQNSLSSVIGSNLKLQDSDSMNQEQTSSESNPRESIDVMPECGSCSISSSISKEPGHDGWPAYRKKLRKVLFKRERKACKKNETFERALFILNTVTKVDVAWQDGTREYGLESTSLIPIRAPSDQEFFPEQYVVEKASNEADDSVEDNRVGIVKSVNSKERTVCVRWFKPVSRPEDPREFSCCEVVSAYELDEHPDYDYCYGDVVVRLSPASTPDSYLEIPSEKLGEPDIPESETDVTEKHLECNPESSKGEAWVKFKSLSWAGNITGLQDGDIEVSWADGMVSKVGPQAVFVVGREDDADSYEGGSDIIDDGASWETVNENEMDILDDAEKEDDSQSANNIPACENTQDSPPEDNIPEKSGALSVPLAAINFVTRLATGLFSRNKRQLDLSNSAHNGFSDSEAQDIAKVIVNGTTADADLDASEHHSHVTTTGDADRVAGFLIESPASDSASTGADSQCGTSSFKHFDISDNPSDNYFFSSIGQGSGERKWVKKIQQEWSILEKNLPDAIYVRVYEDRMDLLRAVIVGASGTPYQDGLFFFDFHLPPEYPQVPPQAYYHSGGLRINPNLYVDGKVCLSLLNTWTGRGNEVWDSSSSSILQVLVSLQGLVLNSKPYFNEAGYEKQVGTIEGEKNSIPYNENTYLLNLKSMLYLMRRPPMHFEAFVKSHFQRRGHYILKACEAYMNGCSIGTLTKDACLTEKSKEQSSSVGFKLMLAKILPKLIASFTEIGGIHSHQFEHLIKP